MKTLQINLWLLNYATESFSIDKDNIKTDEIILTELLSENDKLVYELFINLIGHNNVILTDVNINNDVICFNRMKLFDHDENFNILNCNSYLKSYNDYSEENKSIIDEFLILLNKY